MTTPVPITVAHGDGIGPEIMRATLFMLNEAGARIAPETIAIGESVYLSGHTSGIAPEDWESLRRTKVFLKSPITTPQGGGYKSLNVTIRKGLGLFANVRPNLALAPFVKTYHPKLDLVIVRENEEDLYAGIEHRQTDDVVQCIKLISRQGCERIVRYAFEYARANGRKKVSCFTKDNIMKMTDGLFHRVFNEIGAEYPDIVQDHFIIDIGTALIADTPDRFDVIVTLNLYGDIISDVAAQVAGSVGMAGSSNVGASCAMFEAIHGSAPDIAGKGIANPSGLLNGALMMLTHIGQNDVAETLHNAWLRTIEDGIHTGDIASAEYTKERVGTDAFSKAVVARLGQKPQILKPAFYGSAAGGIKLPELRPYTPAVKRFYGVDVFLHNRTHTAEQIGHLMEGVAHAPFKLKMVSNRGANVYPDGLPETLCVDHWRCRFVNTDDNGSVTHGDVLALLNRINEAGLDFVKTEHLYYFDGVRGYALGQGQ
jgi:isocitrate dehydrogenase